MKQSKLSIKNASSSDQLGYLLTEDITLQPDANARKDKDNTFLEAMESQTNQTLFLLFGVSLLLPWNATMAAMDYFIKIFPSPDYKPSFTFLLAASGPMLGMQIVSFAVQNYIPVQLKMTASLLVNTVVTSLLAVLPSILIRNGQQALCYNLILILMVIQGCAIAFLQSALYGISGISVKLTNKLMLGIGISSVAVNGIRIILLATVSSDEIDAIIFFSFASLFLLITFILALFFVKKYSVLLKIRAGTTDSFQVNYSDHMSKVNDNSFQMQRKQQQSIWYRSHQVYRVIYPSALSVALTFTIQFTFFPGVVLTYKLHFIESFSWFAIGMITLQNFFDTIGRLVGGFKSLGVSQKVFYILCLARLIFIATFVLFYKKVFIEFFQNDAFVIINLILFAFSCGYLGTLGMQFGTSQDCGDQGLAGTIMGFHITLGISLGSLIASLAF